MEFNITINAPREKVWEALWSKATYPQWTTAFHPDSRAETDWKKGSKVLFLGKEDSGMVSRIEDNIPNEYMSIQHLGSVKDGVEDTESEEAKQWAGSFENYRLKDVDGKTELTVTLTDAKIPDEFIKMFEEAWPKALNKLKEISEG